MILNPADGELVWLTPNEIAKLPTLLVEVQKVLPYLFSDDKHVVSYKVIYGKGNKIAAFTLEK